MTPEAKREYERKWYSTTGKQKRVAANKKWKEKVKLEYEQYKASLKCSKCGENHPACLDFHHLDPKQKEISVAVMKGHYSIDSIKEEAEKCIVLCSNCHRKEHYNKVD